MIICHAHMTPTEIGELSYQGVYELLQYISGEGVYGKKKTNILEQDISPADFAKLWSHNK